MNNSSLDINEEGLDRETYLDYQNKTKFARKYLKKDIMDQLDLKHGSKRAYELDLVEDQS